MWQKKKCKKKITIKIECGPTQIALMTWVRLFSKFDNLTGITFLGFFDVMSVAFLGKFHVLRTRSESVDSLGDSM